MQIQNPSYFKRKQLSGNRTAFYFDGITEFNRFIDEVDANATGVCRRGLDRLAQPDYKRQRARNRGWYGTNDASEITNNITTYQFNNELDTFLQGLRSQTVSIDKIDLDQIKSIKFTEQEIGIFSFDLASLGLIPVMEYYSPLLKEIVSGNNVLTRKDADGNAIRNSNGKLIFYHVFKPEIPDHVVEFDAKQNGYFSEVLGRVVEKDELVLDENTNKFHYPFHPEIPEHEVEQRQKEVDGKKSWTTTWKKSFIHIPKVEKPLPRIDIIVGVSFHWSLNAIDQLPYNCMGAIALAEKLSKANVNYRIIVAYGLQSRTGANRKAVSFVCAKKEGEALDKNKMAVLMSDARYCRYQAFRSYFASMYDAGYGDGADEEAIGVILTDNNVIKDIYMDYLATSTDPADVRASRSPDTKVVFSNALSEQESIDQYNNAVQQISRMTIP